jgi:hypothetical protein
MPSMLSGWELGRHVTSIGHRAMLCECIPPRGECGADFGSGGGQAVDPA